MCEVRNHCEYTGLKFRPVPCLVPESGFSPLRFFLLLRQLQALIDEAQAEAETIKDAIKATMGTQEAVTAGEYKITWKPVTTSRLDTAALKKALPDVAAAFTKETTVRRFSVA